MEVMDTVRKEVYDRIDAQMGAIKRLHRQMREEYHRLPQVHVRINKIQDQWSRVELELDVLTHKVFLHQKQSRRASGH